MQWLRSRWLATSFKKQLIILILLGGLMVAALAPLFIVPALIPGLVVLLWSLEQPSSLKRAFLYGWALGFGYFVAGLYWLGYAIAVDLATFWWAMPFALFGLQSALAIFFGLTSMATVWVKQKLNLSGWAVVWMFAFFWLALDLLRSVVFTGFPWNLLGTSLALHPIFMQFASVGGVHLLTLIVLIWAVTPALLASPNSKFTAVLGFLAMPAIVFGFGLYRLESLSEAAQETHPDIQLRLVQANIKQSLKWDPERQRENLQKHLDLSLLPTAEGDQPNLIIWPEAAVTFALNRSVEAQQAFATSIFGSESLTENGSSPVLITGANRVVGQGSDLKAWNHMYALDQSGSVVGGYDKHHLVPFGEYIPYSSLLRVAKITQGAVDFSAGEGPKTLLLDGVPAFSPMICYEGIFTANVVDKSDPLAQKPEWLLSITNDGWFGISSGPHQHLASTVLRSVEEGLPLVRVSNPGISIVTDSLGQTLQKTPLGAAGILDSKLPIASASRPLYSKFGVSIMYLFMLILLLFAFASKWLNQR